MQISKNIEDEVGLSTGLCKRLALTEDNAQVIMHYIKCFESEINLSKSYKKITVATLVYCSRFHSNKKFKDMTKDDIISYLNSQSNPSFFEYDHPNMVLFLNQILDPRQR